MAKQSVSGRTREELEELRQEYDGAFNEQYCLAKIPRQPDDYDGPVRYCINQETYQMGSGWLCPYHGGKGKPNAQNLEKLAAMKHGMDATREHLIEDFDEKDRKLYDWVVEEYPDAYDIEVEVDPSAAYDIHRLAAEIVRAERGRGYLIREGEIHEEEKYSDEGRLVYDDEGNVVTEKSEHYLAKMMHRQDKKITKLQKELGITRKERERQSTNDEAVEAIKSFSELGADLMARDEKNFDPDDEPWEEDSDD